MTQTQPRRGRPTGRPTAGETSKRTIRDRARKRRMRAGGAAAAVFALVAVAAFAVQRSGPTTDALRQAGSTTSAGGPARVGSPLPDFQLTTADGAAVNAAKLRGKAAIVWFTTSYCTPCQEGALKFQKVVPRLGDKAPTMLMVFLDPKEPNSALLQWRKSFGQPTWVPALDTDRFGQRAGVQVLDTKIFVDQTGVVRDINTAPVNDSYLATVQRLATGA